MGKKLFIGGLSWGTSEEGLKEAFSVFGTITSVVIVLDKETRKSRGFGFVEFSQDSEAKKAMEALNNSTLDGRSINVREAVDNRKNDRKGRKNFSQGYNRSDRQNSRDQPRSQDRHSRPQSQDSASRPNREYKKRNFDNSRKPSSSKNASFSKPDWPQPSNDSWGDDKWGKERRRRREGKKKKKNYKKDSRWDDGDWD